MVYGPLTLEYSFDELWSIALPIGVCMAFAVCKLVPRDEVQPPDSNAATGSALFDDFLDFVRSNAAVLLLCVLATAAIKVGLMFSEYGTFNLPPDARSPLRLTLPALQSFITPAVCLFTTWYLVSSTRKEPGHGPSFLLAILLIAGATGFLAFLYDLAFLDQYLSAHPESRPGGEHHVFTVIANILVSVCAFLSVAVFFKARKIKQPPLTVDVRIETPICSRLAPPVQAPSLAPADVVGVASEERAQAGV